MLIRFSSDSSKFSLVARGLREPGRERDLLNLWRFWTTFLGVLWLAGKLKTDGTKSGFFSSHGFDGAPAKDEKSL